MARPLDGNKLSVLLFPTGYLKPTLTPPPLQPRRKNSPSRPQSRFSQGQSPSTGRRGVPPPPTVPREPPPPVPCRMPTSATSAASRHPGQPTNMSPRGKRKTEDANHRGLPPLPPPLHPPHSSTHVSNHNNDNDETTSSNDSDGEENQIFTPINDLCISLSDYLPALLSAFHVVCFPSCLPSFLPSFLYINRPFKMGRLAPTGNPAICQIRRIRHLSE